MKNRDKDWILKSDATHMLSFIHSLICPLGNQHRLSFTHTSSHTCCLVHSPFRQHTLICPLSHSFTLSHTHAVIYSFFKPSQRTYHVSGNLEITETNGPRPSPKGGHSLEGTQMLKVRTIIHCVMYREKMLWKGSVQTAEKPPRCKQRTHPWEQWRTLHKLGLEEWLRVF